MIHLFYKIKQYISNLFWYVYFYISIRKLLNKRNIIDYKVFNFKNWHHGYAYFTGTFEGKKVFIKFDTRLHLLCNDIQAYEVCKPILSEHLVDILFSKITGKLQYLIYEFVEDSVELDEQILSENLDYIDQILYILKNISKKGIVHRDIKLDNFLVVNNKLKIIDFTFSISKNSKELNISDSKNCGILEFLGIGLNPKPFVWDDYYSITQILTELKFKTNGESKRKIDEYIFQSSSLIGKYQYSIKCSSKFYFYKRNFKIKMKEILKLSHQYRNIDND